ncbi:Testis-specific serine/threonine-protein kinase 1 [Orchesella cincta]|uniref:Testis-specific serine/threonine-protein kinase 1 n=1 Tax=Orchesella cincta TaxID=48709 RepID=A0A1D2NLD8_ORCCI|nr:Testis-specific serine/threonine-protein kinase 1 [Orchesella cincta]
MALASPRASTPLPQPTRLNTLNAYLYHHGYRMGKLIGEGSYSKVRLCPRRSDTEDGQEKDPAVACKVINKRKASSDFVNKFLPRELQIVSKIKHLNIVRVYDVVEFDNHVYIFMDYCNNGDLLEYVKQRGFIKEARSQHYFRQVLSAVKYLHGLDIAHRDLKCENVLLTADDHVRLSDFGFARSCRDSKSGKRILSSTYCGSCAYAAPEILQGTSYNPKLYDMWSLGCILFIMLTGHMPFDESNVPKMLQHQMERNLNYPHQMEGVISKSAKRLIKHLLEPDVTRRATIEQAISNGWFSSRPSTGASKNHNAK